MCSVSFVFGFWSWCNSLWVLFLSKEVPNPWQDKYEVWGKSMFVKNKEKHFERLPTTKKLTTSDGTWCPVYNWEPTVSQSLKQRYSRVSFRTLRPVCPSYPTLSIFMIHIGDISTIPVLWLPLLIGHALELCLQILSLVYPKSCHLLFTSSTDWRSATWGS